VATRAIWTWPTIKMQRSTDIQTVGVFVPEAVMSEPIMRPTDKQQPIALTSALVPTLKSGVTEREYIRCKAKFWDVTPGGTARSFRWRTCRNVHSHSPVKMVPHPVRLEFSSKLLRGTHISQTLIVRPSMAWGNGGKAPDVRITSVLHGSSIMSGILTLEADLLQSQDLL